MSSKREPHQKSYGFTLIELIVALSLSALLTVGIYMSWNYINRHMFYREKINLFRDETTRIGTEIAGNIRRSHRVIMWRENSIRMLCRDGSDTLIYEFDGDKLFKNHKPVQNRSGARTTAFSLRDIRDYHDLGPLVLKMTLAAESDKGHWDTVMFDITVNSYDENEDTFWGF